MPNPMTAANFGDLLDPRFQGIFEDVYTERPDMLPVVYNFVPDNGRNNMMWSQVGAVEDFVAFDGQVKYSSMNQGYDTTATFVEFARGIQIERKLFDFEQYNIMDQRPRGLARAAFRTRQKHGAQFFNNMGSVDRTFYVNTEAVAPVSNSHTTTSGASTSTGFDNMLTGALNAVNVQTAYILMRGFRGDQAATINLKIF